MPRHKVTTKQSNMKRVADDLTDFEKEVFLSVVRASVVAMHTQAPIQRLAAMHIYFKTLSKDALLLGQLFVDSMRELNDPKDIAEDAEN